MDYLSRLKVEVTGEIQQIYKPIDLPGFYCTDIPQVVPTIIPEKKVHS